LPHASTALGAQSELRKPNTKPKRTQQDMLCVMCVLVCICCVCVCEVGVANMPGAGRYAREFATNRDAAERLDFVVVVVVVVVSAQHALVNYTLICCVKCLFNGSPCRHVFHTFIHSLRSTCGAQNCQTKAPPVSMC